MDKLRIKNIVFAVLLLLLSGSQVVFADDPVPDMPGAVPSSTPIPPPPPASAIGNSGQPAPMNVPPSPARVSAGPPSPLDIPVVPAELPANAFAAPVVQSRPLSYQESQQTMLDSVPTRATSPEANAAFNALMQQNMPLTPQQVIRLRQLIDLSQRAASTPPTVPPKPVSTTIMMNLAPGTTPPAIRLAKGYVTSLVFVDSTGAPWPVASYEIGDPKATNIQWDGKSNVLLIQAATTYSDGDIVIRLAGLMTPLTLELVSGQRVVDYRTDIHVSGIGPNTKDVPTGNGLPMGANQLLLSVLDGIAPPGGKTLLVKGGDCQAWILGDKMYLRTRLTLLSPGWVGKMVSPDGMNAYELQRSSSVLVSQYGEPIELKIEGF
jgi:intracellular multiplication protein IcmK